MRYKKYEKQECQANKSILVCVAVLVKFLTHKILPKLSAKLSAIFRSPGAISLPHKKSVEKLHIVCSRIFSLLARFFEITIFAEILKFFAEFVKDSIFRA